MYQCKNEGQSALSEDLGPLVGGEKGGVMGPPLALVTKNIACS